jgi:hypothetical protein
MPVTTTIRVAAATHERLQRLAREEARSIGQVIAALLDDYERRRFFAGLAEDFARLTADAVAQGDDGTVIAAWKATRRDRLDEPLDDRAAR